MADTHSKEVRSKNMSHIRSTNTKPEETVRKYLFSRGLRYRKNVRKLPGCPDIVLPKYKTIVFVNGCFWHGHEGCKYYVLPKTNVDFWQNKIERNRSRDREERQQLTSMGWHCITIWECQLKPKIRQQTLDALEYMLCHIYLEDRRIKPYETTEEEYSMVAESATEYGNKSE